MVKSSLEPLLEALPIPALAIADDGRLVAVNTLAQSLLGPGILGRHYMTVLRQPEVLAALEHAESEAEPQSATFQSNEAGRATQWSLRVAPVEQALVVTFVDETPAVEVSQIQRDFVANVSHELRTPLTALMGFIETLRGPARDDAAARDRFLEVMTREAGRMNRLVGDLLSLSRVEAEERQRPTDPVDLGAVVSNAVSALRSAALERGVTVEMDLPPEGSAERVVPGHADQLAQVATNLIENAIKYGREDGHVWVTLLPLAEDGGLAGGALCLCVRDDGPGIDPVHLPRLTQRFYRVDSHRSREMGGTGLGLAIVKHIVNRHRGRLKVNSELGQGTRFQVTLPRA